MLARNWENVSKQNTCEFYLDNLFLKRSTFCLHLQSSISMNLIMNQDQVDDNMLKFPYSIFFSSFIPIACRHEHNEHSVSVSWTGFLSLSSDSKVMTIQGL